MAAGAERGGRLIPVSASKYDREDPTSDESILRTATPGLSSLALSMDGLFTHYLSGRLPPPLALTEYNAVFRRSEGCGASQQYVSLLFQAKVIGEAVSHGKGGFGLAAYYASQGASKACNTWGSGRSRAADDSYGMIAWGSQHTAKGLPTPAYYAL